MNVARDQDGYRRTPGTGPAVRSDIIEVYIFRRGGQASEFLQLLRAAEPLKGCWHPVMGHIESGETAVAAAIRELREEVGLDPCGPAAQGLWALEQVHPFFVAAIDAIVLSPRFAAEVSPDWQPALNAEHSAARWTADPDQFMWPGQRAAAREVLAEIAANGSPSREALRIRL